MIDTEYNKEIKQRMAAIDRNAIVEQRKQNTHDRPRGMHSISANTSAQAFQNLHAFKATNKPTKTAKGGGGINASEEVEDARRVEIENAMGAGKGSCETKYKKQMPILGGGNMEMTDAREHLVKGGSFPPNTFSRLTISQLTDQKGAGWADALKEVAAAPAAPVIGAGMSKRTARADKIKEIMKEKGMKMTEASSYIKKNNISY